MGISTPETVRRIVSDPSLDIDEKVLRIAKIGDSLIPLLLASLEPSNDLFEISFRTLSLLGTPAIPGLLKKINSKNNATSLYAAKALVSIGPEAVDFIRDELMRSSEVAQVKFIKILASINTLDSLDILQNCLSNPSEIVRETARYSLIQFGSAGRKALIKSLENNSFGDDNGDLYDITGAIARLGVVSIPELINVLKNKDNSFASRSTAAKLLGGILNNSFFNDLYKNKDNQIRALALIGVSEVPRKEGYSLLKIGLHDPDVFVKTTAIDLVTSWRFLHSQIFLSDLIEMLSSEEEYIRYEIVRSLRFLRVQWDKNVILAIIPRLWDEDKNVGEQALLTLDSATLILQEIKISKRVIGKILDFAQDDNVEIRKAAFGILCWINSPHVTQKIRNLLFSSNLPNNIRIELLMALEKHRSSFFYSDIQKRNEKIIHEVVNNPNNNQGVLEEVMNNWQYRNSYLRSLLTNQRSRV